MSRARPINGMWFDQKRNHKTAKIDQLELLAAAENLSMDDLLDEGLTQGQLILRLRTALGEGVIPPEILERKRERRRQAQRQPTCAICSVEGLECEGNITRHHFVPRWLMRELENYHAYSARPSCTIPVCLGRHRDLHYRDDDTPKSIAKYLNEHQRKLAQKMLDDLHEQHPRIFDLISGGDETSYEYQLVRDFQLGLFRAETGQELELSGSFNSFAPIAQWTERFPATEEVRWFKSS